VCGTDSSVNSGLVVVHFVTALLLMVSVRVCN
jgi:hypothetical protein